MKSDYEAIFGFDGYIDSIYHALSGRTTAGAPVRFEKKADFARIVGHPSSADIELERVTEKRGGNAPLTAEALARLGVRTLCMGMTGTDEPDDMFKTDCELLEHFPLGEPARTMALEFTDSKLMLADVSGFHGFDFDALCARVGLEELKALFRGARLIGLVNYSASSSAKGLWGGLRAHVLNAAAKTDKKLYFDLSDPSRRTEDELKDCLKLINDFSRGYETSLSLNLNEARRVSVALRLDCPTLSECALGIFAEMDADYVIIHSADECVCAHSGGSVSKIPERVSSPAVLTGAGDTFGAGYCMGWLRGLSCERRLETACAAARSYIENGDASFVHEAVADVLN